jgi:hypothetical protein
MLIDYDSFDSVQTGFVAGFFVIAVLLFIAAKWTKRFLLGIGGLLAIVLAFVSIVLPDSYTMPVFLAKGSATSIQIKRNVLTGILDYRFANGATEQIQRRNGPAQLVINDADTPLLISEVSYSTSTFGYSTSNEKEPTMIAPFSLLYTDFNLWIDYFGDGADKPPPSIKTRQFAEVRRWLHEKPNQQQ